MRSVYKVVSALACYWLLLSGSAALAQDFFCSFDAIKTGMFESVAKTSRGYEITINQDGQSFTGVIDSTMPFYYEAEKFMTESETVDTSRPLAMLYENNQMCGFLRTREDHVYVEDYNLRNDNYILSVCTDYTGDCYKLKISPGNRLYDQAENVLQTFILNVIHVFYMEGGELLSAVAYE